MATNQKHVVTTVCSKHWQLFDSGPVITWTGAQSEERNVDVLMNSISKNRRMKCLPK